MVRATPEIHGKFLEFCNFLPVPCESPGKTVIFPILLKFSCSLRNNIQIAEGPKFLACNCF